MKKLLRITLAAVIAAGLFGAGYLTAQSKFGTPKTILSISLIKWKPGSSPADRQKALDGVKEMAAAIPGIKNVWIKAVRMQPREYDAAFVIEFESREAADNYADTDNPVRKKWREHYLSIREASISPQVSN